MQLYPGSHVYLQQVLRATEKDVEILNIQNGNRVPCPIDFMTCCALEINRHK